MKILNTFSGFSAPDIAAAKHFYGETLGIEVTERPQGLELKLTGGSVFVYPSQDNQPAAYTILNFVVENIDAAVDELVAKGIVMERYPNLPADEKGVMRNDGKHPGPGAIAWFKDPAGNILSVIQE